MDDNIFQGVGVEIKLKDPEDFLKIAETLTRIGVASKKDNTIFQSCHILHKRGNYAILHFKELFVLDGKTTDISDDDYTRRDSIAQLLEQWGLLEIIDKTDLNKFDLKQIKIVPYSQKNEWKLESKYNIGRKK